MTREQKIHVYWHEGRWYFKYGLRPPIEEFGSIHPMVLQMERFYNWRRRVEGR